MLHGQDPFSGIVLVFRATADRAVPAVRSFTLRCDAAVCAAISIGSARIGIDALTDLRAVLDTRSSGRPSDGSLTPLDGEGGFG